MRDLEHTGALSNRAICGLLTIIVALGAALRILSVDSALWYDEMVTLIDSVRAPFASIVTQFPSNNNHVLYSVLAHGSVAAFGEHSWSLRLPAVIFGIASLPMLYLLGAHVTSRFEAIWATLLLAVSYHHIWYSQNARGYTILLFCALLTSYLLLVGLREDRRSSYLQYGIVSALSAYAHLTMVLFVLGQATVVAWQVLARSGWRFKLRDWQNPILGFAAAGIFTLVLYAPVLADVQAFFGREPKGAAVASAGWAVAETLRGLQLGYGATGGIVVGGILMASGVWSYFRRSPLVLALFVVPGAALFAATVLLQRPTFPRFFFFLAGFALLIVVRGAVVVGQWAANRLPENYAGRRWGGMLPVFILAGMTLVSVLAVPGAYRYPKQDYERALRYVESSAGARDTIVVAGGGAAIPYRDYYGKPWKRIADAAEIETLRKQYDNVWLLYTFGRYIEALEPDVMNAILARCAIAGTFPGTVAGGEIVVRRCSAN